MFWAARAWRTAASAPPLVSPGSSASCSSPPPPRGLPTRSSSSSLRLAALLNFVHDNSGVRKGTPPTTKLTADDVFRLATLVVSAGGGVGPDAADDPLDLLTHGPFRTALQHAAMARNSEFGGFQRAQVDAAVRKLQQAAASPGGIDPLATRSDAGPPLVSGQGRFAPTTAAALAVPVSESLAPWSTPSFTATTVTDATSSRPSPAPIRSEDLATPDEIVSELLDVSREFLQSKHLDSARLNRLIVLAVACSGKASAVQIVSMMRSLASVNAQDYQAAAKLSRRACELASSMTLSDACLTLSAASRLNVQDSMSAVVSRVESEAAKLTLKDCSRILDAIDRHHQTVMSNLHHTVQHVCHICQGRVNDLDTRMLLMLVDACARYTIKTPAAKLFVDTLVNHRIAEVKEGRLLHVLQCVQHMGLLSAPVFQAILARATSLAATMELRQVEQLIDVVSVVPFDASTFMSAIMERLSVDAGQLSSSQLGDVLSLIGSYPPAKQHPVVSSLAIAAKMRVEGMSRATLTTIVLSLVQAGYFGLEFYQLADVLMTQRGGLKSADELNDWLDALTRTTAADERMQLIIVTAVKQLSPTLQAQEVDSLRGKLMQLGVKEARAMLRLSERSKTINQNEVQRQTEKAAALASRHHHRGGGAQSQGARGSGVSPATQPGSSKKKQPFDFKRALWDMDI